MAARVVDPLEDPQAPRDGRIAEGHRPDLSDAAWALSRPLNQSTRKIDFIRTLFDALFFHLDRIGHCLNSGLVELGDVKAPVEYYSRLLAVHSEVFTKYFRSIGYQRMGHLLGNFTEWKTASAALMNGVDDSEGALDDLR